MKITFTLFLTALSSVLFAQELKTIEAVQGNDSDYFDYEDAEAPHNPVGNPAFLPGCSWYCGGSVKTITASSELKGNGNISYTPKNAHDFDKNTAWVEGKSDYGIGEFIEYHFDFSEMKNYDGSLGITKILIANGYKKSKRIWENNSRIKQLKVYLNDRPYAMLNLLDTYEIQTIDIGEITFPAGKETKLTFEIAQVYKGKKYKDTALSLLMFDGIGVH